jgi:hypothetical protein
MSDYTGTADGFDVAIALLRSETDARVALLASNQARRAAFEEKVAAFAAREAPATDYSELSPDDAVAASLAAWQEHIVGESAQVRDLYTHINEDAEIRAAQVGSRPDAMLDPDADIVLVSLGRALRYPLPLGPIVSAMLEAGWTHANRDEWLKWSLIKAEGGDLRRTAKQIVRDMGLRPGPAVDAIATMLIHLTAETGALTDGNVLGLRALILGRLWVCRSA